MKKLLLGLGTFAAIAAPVASVLACLSDEDSEAIIKEKNSSIKLTSKIKNSSKRARMIRKIKAAESLEELKKLNVELWYDILDR